MTVAVRKKRFTVDEYHRMAELGLFAQGDRIELIRGEIIEMAAKGTAHTVCCGNLVELLVPLVVGQAQVRCQDPITLPTGSEPEPDLVIVQRRSDRYLSGHPQPADVLVVMEVADSSLDYDREVKGPLYAEFGIPHYWIFNVLDGNLEVYGEPRVDEQGRFSYGLRRVLLRNQSVELPGFDGALLQLDQVLPPAR